MTNFSFVQPNMGLGEPKKNYVFVDEHNRHKRLKVMRACEGCRKRKIKCDAATTNTWPCAACVRLKMSCVPPTVTYNQLSMGVPLSASNLEQVLDFGGDSSGESGDERGPAPSSVPAYTSANPSPASLSNAGSNAAADYVAKRPKPDHLNFHPPPTSAPTLPMQPYIHSPYGPPTGSTLVSNAAPETWSQDTSAVVDLQNVMGNLEINDNGTAPYITEQRQTVAEAPALDEVECSLPVVTTGSGSSVRIPPQLMPDARQALEFFDIFFSKIHPYVPVVWKPYFLQQWQNNREAISPLLLEAIFACAGRASSDPAQGAQWLALAAKHETCFMDSPRLSTIQALLILLKARESNPKRGYYYRSWMTLKTACSMGKDLGLDEHYESHQNGETCDDPIECMTKTRVWQTIFVGEIFVGGPQGRRDMGCMADTVDFSMPSASPGGDANELSVSRHFVQLARGARSVRALHEAYLRIAKTKTEWKSHAVIIALNPQFFKWAAELPPEMQIHYPPDGSPPWLASHVVGNIHCYYHLGILLLRRPQLKACFGKGDSWREHMAVCYESSKLICRIQEAVIRDFGVDGLLCMQRGINFAIYCILTCTLIHLAAITSPLPEYNTDAKDYFTRHMRVLERCIEVQVMPDMQAQIQSLREAFSADIHRPFELRPSFPYENSKQAPMVPSPPLDEVHDSGLHIARSTHSVSPYSQGVITPPTTHDLQYSKEGSTSISPMPMLASTGIGPTPDLYSSPALPEDGLSWNPSRLFDQWNSAFGPPSATTTPTAPSTMPSHPSPPIYNSAASSLTHGLSSSISAANVPEGLSVSHFPASNVTGSNVGDGATAGGASVAAAAAAAAAAASANMNVNVNVNSSLGTVSQMAAPTYTAADMAAASFISPSMWQDTVASAYVPRDLKRRWDAMSVPAWPVTSAGVGDAQHLIYN